MFKKVQFSLFKKQLSRAGIQHQVEAVYFLQAAAEIFQELFGDGAAKHAKPLYVKENTLTVEIAHPSIAEMIRDHEKEIISQMYNKTGRKIYRIQCSVPRHDPNEYQQGY